MNAACCRLVDDRSDGSGGFHVIGSMLDGDGALPDLGNQFIGTESLRDAV